jgi:hypothetical protein
METMSSPAAESIDLLDLKLLPAWVKEPGEARNYEHYTGEEERGRRCRRGDGRSKRPTPNAQRSSFDGREADPHKLKKAGRDSESVRERGGRARRQTGQRKDRHKPNREGAVTRKPFQIGIHFLPLAPALENVVAQIKSGSVAYSLFALARLFLEKPGRYEVRLTATADSPLFQLGENGAFSLDREFLDRNAFRLACEDFYKIDITQSDAIKGDFSNVARCRLSGILLGPTNHHNYQPQLRTLYEQRFSRRMGFADYQRQIEIVNDPTLIERWKEEARTVKTYTTLREEMPSTFASATEAERHFRSNYLPGLIRSREDVTVDGVLSRRLPDRILNRAVEDAWTHETRSPSNLMQELAGRLRQASLHVFRHRRGMLFVSPIRPRPFVYEHAGVSRSVNAILEALATTPGSNRKELLEKLITDTASENAEQRKLALASDLHWLVSEGYVIEFNDGSLDLPRGKAKPATVSTASAANEKLALAAATASVDLIELEIGGS